MERVVKVVLDLLVVKFLFRYANKPIYIFGGFGIAAMMFSFAILALALALKVLNGTSLILTPLPPLAGMMFLIVVLIILMGLLAEMLSRTYHESQSKPVYRIARIVQAVKNEGS